MSVYSFANSSRVSAMFNSSSSLRSIIDYYIQNGYWTNREDARMFYLYYLLIGYCLALIFVLILWLFEKYIGPDRLRNQKPISWHLIIFVHVVFLLFNGNVLNMLYPKNLVKS